MKGRISTKEMALSGVIEGETIGEQEHVSILGENDLWER